MNTSSKIYTFKKIKTQQAIQAFKIHIPPLLVIVIENDGKYIYGIKKWHSQGKKFKSFQNKYWKFLSKNFAENEMEKLSRDDSSFFRQLEKCHDEHYPDNLI